MLKLISSWYLFCTHYKIVLENFYNTILVDQVVKLLVHNVQNQEYLNLISRVSKIYAKT